MPNTETRPWREVHVIQYQLETGMSDSIRRHSQPFVSLVCEGDTPQVMRERIRARMGVDKARFKNWDLMVVVGNRVSAISKNSSDDQYGCASDGDNAMTDTDDAEVLDLYHYRPLFPSADDRRYNSYDNDSYSDRNVKPVLGLKRADPNPRASRRHAEQGITIK